MDLQTRFPQIARRFEAAGLPGPISDSCLFILSKRHELFRHYLDKLIGKKEYSAYWSSAEAEFRTEYSSLSPELQTSWCFWRIFNWLEFEYTLEDIQGHGSNADRLDFLEDLVELLEEAGKREGNEQLRNQSTLLAAATDRLASLYSSQMQLFDPEFAAEVEKAQRSHSVSDSYIHSIEAVKQQAQERIRALQREVQPVAPSQWRDAFDQLQQAHREFLDVAKELDQTYHIELCSWSQASSGPPDDMGMGKAAADMVEQHVKLQRVQRELASIRGHYHAIATSAAPLQDLDQAWLRRVGAEALERVSELKREVALLGGVVEGGAAGGGGGRMVVRTGAGGSWGGTSSSASTQ